MLNRYESKQRNYTELCNRSSTRSLQLGHAGSPMPRNCDSLEDYWQDASVSLRSCHSWDATSSRHWLGATTSAPEKIDEEDESKSSTGSISPRIRPCRYSFDGIEDMACLRGRRSFPPPLASCSTLSIKEGGRFVLKEMDAERPHGFFRAQRGNGRLRLQLVLPDEVNDEEDNHEGSSPSPVEDSIEPVEFGHEEHDAHVEEIPTSYHEEEGRSSIQNGGPEFVEINACSTFQDVGVDGRYAILDKSLPQQVGMKNARFEAETISALDVFYSDDPHRDLSNCREEAGLLEADSFRGDNFLAYSKLELNQFVAEGNNSVSNQALANLSPWSPKKMCLHQSIVSMRPALGLAMS